jgi:hypothetical protein
VSSILPYLKTVFGFFTPGAVILGSAVTATSDGGANVTQAEWITALVACVVTGSLVFGVPNKDPNAQHQAESVQPPERGQVNVGLVIGVLLVIILVVVLLRLI